MNIRPAQLSDASGIAQVHTQSWRETYAGRIPAAFLDAMTDDAAWLGRLAQRQQALENPALETLVAESGSQVVGFVSGGPARGEPKSDAESGAELYALYLLRDFQGSGAGRALVQALACRLRARGYARLMLWVLKDNPTEGFYRHLGGVQSGEKTERVLGGELKEVAYRWPDIGVLC